MAWVWEVLYHPPLATSTWSILRHWLLTRHNTNHRCGSVMLMTHLWSDLMAQSGYRISSATSIVSGLSSNSLWKHSSTVRFRFWTFWSSRKRQRRSRHVSAAKNKHARIEELLEAAFSMRSVPRLHSEGRRRSELAFSSRYIATTSEQTEGLMGAVVIVIIKVCKSVR
jgi:hypothetical protein